MISALRMDVERRRGEGSRLVQCRDGIALVAGRAGIPEGAEFGMVPGLSIKRVSWHSQRRASAVCVTQLRFTRPQVPGVMA
jgi:hypothetical protein